ncbi:hypothetical protein EZH22_14000 [Xanthobacter dioxanivorans]|uniref:Uncharacterized protein n=1 Tax=Xanthobacter dioxanivorans TaxID=2528964 RepID=A0A974SKW7_9HYPH|nr:hypothetical protein [Xanthobacter dioxanivorans]QRG09265.1 hypothetical protein EZH22_14000 [Xanthobacter dioxanivorans]
MSLEPIAFCRDYRGLMDALKARRVALGFTQMEVDDRAGLQDGYTGKLEAWDRDSGRRLGPVSLELLLVALDVQIALVELRPPAPRAEPDPAQLRLPLVGGDMRRRTDQDFVRLPGRNRRREAQAQADQQKCAEVITEAAE